MKRKPQEGFRIAWRQSFEKSSDLWHTHGDRVYGRDAEDDLARLCAKVSGNGITQWYEWFDEASPDAYRCKRDYAGERFHRERNRLQGE